MLHGNPSAHQYHKGIFHYSGNQHLEQFPLWLMLLKICRAGVNYSWYRVVGRVQIVSEVLAALPGSTNSHTLLGALQSGRGLGEEWERGGWRNGLEGRAEAS